MTLCVGLTQGGRDITMVRYSNGHLRQHRGRRKLGSEAHYAPRRAVQFHALAAASTQGSYVGSTMTTPMSGEMMRSNLTLDLTRRYRQNTHQGWLSLADIPLRLSWHAMHLDKFERVGRE